MRIFAISDLHLKSALEKDMNMFGSHWIGHWDKITSDWMSRVGEGDVVLIAGDISWAMRYDEVMQDLNSICDLPGHKVLIKGNHDYWHSSLAKTRGLLYNNTNFLQNDAISIGKYVFAGSRGWKQPGDKSRQQDDEKVYAREVERLKLSLAKAKNTALEMIGITHFPPYDVNGGATQVTQLFTKYGVKKVVYGHLHRSGTAHHALPDITIDDTRYIMTSCDYLDFKLRTI
jgi:predicted phosphohydrolase